MPDKKKRAPRIVGPKAPFVYPKLSEPDYGTEKYPKKGGEYSSKQRLELADPETQKLLDKLQPFYEEALEVGAQQFSELKVADRKKLGEMKSNPLYETEYDEETEEETGFILIKAKMAASYTPKRGPQAGKTKKMKPTIFDARGKPMKNVPDIWGGTIGRLSFYTSPYFVEGQGTAGLSLRLVAAQIIELIGPGMGRAEDYGFGDEGEDGYVHDDSEVEEKDDSFNDEGDDDEDGSDF